MAYEYISKKDRAPSDILYEKLHDDLNYRFISGKYFTGDTEQTENNFNRFIRDRAREERVKASPSLIDDVKKLFIMYSDSNELWPELKIVKKAKELGPIEEDDPLIKDEPFKLEPKQYMIINRLLYHRDEEVMFITTGVGGSGKSTFLNILKQLFDNDTANVPLSELNGFMIAQAISKRLICSDELGKDDVDGKVLKTIISGQEMDVNPKYGKPYHARCQSALFYCCNQAPKIPPLDSGLLRRIYYYERNTKIDNPDTSLNKKQFTEEQLLWIARRALAYDSISDWKQLFNKETHKYIMKDNSVYLCGMDSTYLQYKENCKNKGYKAYSEINYIEIKKLFKEWIDSDAKDGFINSTKTNNSDKFDMKEYLKSKGRL